MALKNAIATIAQSAPEAWDKNRLALDQHFDDPQKKFQAMLDDFQKGRIPHYRLPELLKENFFEKDDATGVTQGPTLLSYAADKLSYPQFKELCATLSKRIGAPLLRQHLEAPSSAGPKPPAMEPFIHASEHSKTSPDKPLWVQKKSQ